MRTKAEAVAALRADQQFWRDLAARVGPDRYAEPGPMGQWTFGADVGEDGLVADRGLCGAGPASHGRR
jgi:hypothetical protein